ncbi:hypothetical protein [Clostridium oryzae]|uniref:Uncharacterized protein n=1 Tax=Clostridium oryzae TaxID=1450648 RepID=A0A1V4IKF5_9CLOT|nr:hypothetical protein [Clostridium oryzae]OPJ60416.1 hypothetical protein CLORY_28690 [Clostridium oryzae]
MKNISLPKRISIIGYSISTVLFMIIAASGISLQGGDELGYYILNFYIIMPLSTVITAYFITLKKGYLFWLYPIYVGILGEVIPFLIFHTFDIISLFFAFFPALLGLVIGIITNFINITVHK